MSGGSKGKVNQLWIAVGLIGAVAAFGLSYYLTSNSTAPTAPPPPANGQLVVIAKVSIPSGTLLTPNLLSVTRIKGLLPSNAYTSCQSLVGEACATTPGVSAPNVPTLSKTQSYYAVVPIAANTVITQGVVAPNKVAQVPSFGNLSLPPGDVAIAIPLSSQQAVAGYLQAGDRIDIISNAANGNTAFSFEDIPVLGIGSPSTAGASTAASSAGGGLVVLQVTRSQALGIEELEKTGAIYTVALRSSADYGHGYIPVTASPADNYTQACVVGSTVNPIVEQDLQQAKADVKAASAAYNAAQQAYSKANAALQSLSPNSSQATVDKQTVLSDAATLSQDQFALIEAQNEVTSAQDVLYCGASAALAKSSANGLATGSPQMLQGLFGINVG